MFSHTHLIAGVLAGVIGYKLQIISPIDIAVIAIITVLIDFDHLILYFLEQKDINMRKFFNNVADDNDQHRYRSFIHRKYFFISMVAITIIISVLHPRTGYIIGAAYFMHMLLDYVSSINLALNHYKPVKIYNIVIKLSRMEHTVFAILFLATIIISL